MLHCLQPDFYHVIMHAWRDVGHVSILRNTVFFYLVVSFYYSVICIH